MTPSLFPSVLQKMRRQLDSTLREKVAYPRAKLYDPTNRDPSPNSQLIQAIIDLITKEDYSQQVSVSVYMHV